MTDDSIHTVKHPAKFSDPILTELARWIPDNSIVLDPFAGTGRIHELANLEHRITTVGVEIEPEWAAMHPGTKVGNALDMHWCPSGWFDVIATSPTYGNRMADHHNAQDGSRRMTYTHTLGRPLHPYNSGRMQWGIEYQDFHAKAWREAVRVLRSQHARDTPGRFLLNVSDHIRSGKRIQVSMWHVSVLESLGLRLVDAVEVQTQRMGMGANREARVGCEYVVVLEKP